MSQCAGPARCYGRPAGAAPGPQTAAWPASTSAAFMMPPMPKAGAIRDAEGHDGSRRHAPDVPDPLPATVATGALYMFRASKCTGAHTPLHGHGRHHLGARLRTHWIHGATT